MENKQQFQINITEEDIQNSKSDLYFQNNKKQQVEDKQKSGRPEALLQLEDRRIQINQIKQKTFQSTIGILYTKIQINGMYGTYKGTGCIIFNKNKRPIVLTCAHNFVQFQNDLLKNALSSLFVFSQEDQQGNKFQSYIKEAYIHNQYNYEQGIFSGSDIAIGYLEEEEEEKILEKVQKSCNSTWGSVERIKPKKGEKIVVIGYPGEKNGQLYYMEGEIKDIVQFQDKTPKCLIYYNNIDTTGGQSGSPVFLIRNNVYYLIGIHIGFDVVNNQNLATGITDEVCNEINQTQNFIQFKF